MAITMTVVNGQFIPQIDHQTCTVCGLCLQLCPGIDFKSYQLACAEVLIDERSKRHHQYFSLFSKNRILRWNGASGGIITTLLCEMLKKGAYKSAYVVPLDKIEYGEVQLTQVCDEYQARAASRSKYIPVSCEHLVTAMIKRAVTSCIITATPCVLLGIKKVIDYFEIAGDFLFLGLFCRGVYNTNIFNFFEQCYRRKDEAITEFSFKSKTKNGWPGDVRIVFDSASETFISHNIRRQLWPFFMLWRCDLCYDRFNCLADISFGDCYVKSEKTYEGTSNIIVRGEKGKRVFNKHKHLFDYKRIAIVKVEQSQEIDQVRERYERALGYEQIIMVNGDKDSWRLHLERKYRKLIIDRKRGNAQQYKTIRLIVYFRLIRYFSYLSIRKIFRLFRLLENKLNLSSHFKKNRHYV